MWTGFICLFEGMNNGFILHLKGVDMMREKASEYQSLAFRLCVQLEIQVLQLASFERNHRQPHQLSNRHSVLLFTEILGWSLNLSGSENHFLILSIKNHSVHSSALHSKCTSTFMILTHTHTRTHTRQHRRKIIIWLPGTWTGLYGAELWCGD